jgi:hypothetical protein
MRMSVIHRCRSTFHSCTDGTSAANQLSRGNNAMTNVSLTDSELEILLGTYRGQNSINAKQICEALEELRAFRQVTGAHYRIVPAVEPSEPFRQNGHLILPMRSMEHHKQCSACGAVIPETAVDGSCRNKA